MDDNNKQVGLTPEGNVLITQEEIESSKREEALSLRNVTKTPLYKLAAKLYETSVSLIELLPKRFTGFSDQIIHDAAETLKLVSFVPNKRYLQPASHGVLMVGTVIKNNRLYLANRTIARMKERINGFN